MMFDFGEDGKALEKWIKCEGNGKFSKMWNGLWGPIICLFSCVIPLLISFVILIILDRLPSIDDHGKKQKPDIELNQIGIGVVCLLSFSFAYFFTCSKN